MVHVCKVMIVMHHKPPLGLFTKNEPAPQIILPLMFYWSLLLDAYDFKIQYHLGKSLSNEDRFSQVMLSNPEVSVPLVFVLIPE